MTEFSLLNQELREAGVPDFDFFGNKGLPLDTLVNTRTSSKPYLDILFRYLPRLAGNEQEMVVRALAEKGNIRAIPYLLDIFKQGNEANLTHLWEVGNALYIIDDKSAYPAIVELCKDARLGIARQMLLGTLSKIKTEEAFQVLVNCLEDNSVKGHAMEALGKLGDQRAVPILEKTAVEKGKYEYKAKEAALKRLLNKDKNTRLT